MIIKKKNVFIKVDKNILSTDGSYRYNIKKLYNLTGINDDVVGLSEVDAQNKQFGSYTTKNFFEEHCGMKKPISFATRQPNVFYTTH